MKKQIKPLLVLFFLQCLTVTTLLAQAGLIASYPFKGNAHDETGNGYNGTVSGATLSDDRFGNPMSAYSFDGINDKIVIGKEPNFPSWDTYAVSLWFLNDGGGDQGQGYGQKILSKAQFYTDFHLGVLNDGSQGRLSWWSAQGGFNSVDATNQDYRDNQWHHVVLNKNSPVNGDIWVDGVLQNSSNDLQAVFNNEDLVIGFTTHSDGYQRKYWSGKIDDIRIYNGVLSESEISDLFTEGDYCLDSVKFYKDGDGDKYGNVSVSVSAPACEPPAGYVSDSTDCNDADAAIYPEAHEIIGDGVDNNCNGEVDEKLNNALNFDGADDYVQTAISSGITFTLEAWIKPDIKGADVAIIGNDDNAWHGKNWMLSSNGKMYIHNAHPYVVTDIWSTGKVPFGEWSHVVASVNAGTVTFYINGIMSGGGSTVEQYGLSWGIGMAWRSPLGGAYKGQIDEVRIWNIARTQAEIKAGMMGGVCGNAKGLVAYYPFNQGIAGGTNTGVTTAEDFTSKNHDGALHNFALTGATSNWVEGGPGNTNTCPAPTGLTVRHISDTCAVLSWDAPCTDIAALQVRYRAAGETAWARKKKDASKHVLYINELAPNTTYNWQLRSLCTEDTSGWVNGPDFTTLSSTAFSSDESIVEGNKVQGNISAQIMPNPSNGNFGIQLQLPAKAANTSLALYNNMGEKVWQQDAGKISGAVYKNISLQNQLPAGIYMMVIQRNDVRLMRKIVISK